MIYYRYLPEGVRRLWEIEVIWCWMCENMANDVFMIVMWCGSWIIGEKLPLRKRF